MYISGTELGFEPMRLLSTILNEGSKFWMALRTLVLEALSNSSLLMVTELPVNDSCLMFVMPVITTVEIKVMSSSIVTSRTWPALQVLVKVLNPTLENSRTTSPEDDGSKVRLNLPDASVSTPTLVPFTMTATPCSGLALASTTLPETVILLSSAYAFGVGKNMSDNKITNAER